ncbi:MAG: T9SS type A sorting domain-containing protein [Roseivirga sp.]|nr:T9SS type A sorting domain-containing protein [Roseivirga sp.]
MKYWRRKALVLGLCAAFLNLHAQQAQLVSALINGCDASDGLSEYMFVYSGGTDITNAQASNIDVRYGNVSAATATGITDSYTSNSSFVTDLNNLLPGSCDFSFASVTFGVTDITAGSHILILNDGVTTAIDFDGLCGQGLGTVYVLFSTDTDWPDAGAFEDDPSTNRFFRSVINGTTTDFDYNNTSQLHWSTSTNGDYVQWNDGGGSGAIYSNYTNCTPVNTDVLPVTLLNFEAQPMQDHVAIRWATAKEVDNSHFTLYKSSDVMNWTEVAMIAGKDVSTETVHYEYIDKNPLAGRAYYRLKQTDFNGLFEIFEIISVTFDPAEVALKLYPNPATDYISINCSESISCISLINSQGLVYRVDALTSSSMANRFDIRQLPKGIYRVLIHGEKTVFREKLIKVN